MTKAPDSSPATFNIASRLVLVPVNVRDRNARPVISLSAKDFSVLDDHVEQPIVSFSKDDAPSSVVLVLDISGSMQRELPTVKSAARSFLSAANPSDEFLLTTVSTAPVAALAFSSDTDSVEASVASKCSGGLTALFDAAYLGLNQMRRATNSRRAMIVLSDGLDNHSRYSRNELLRAALEADVQIYSIIVNTGGSGSYSGSTPFRPVMVQKPGDVSADSQGPELLEKLAEKTGGLRFHPRNRGEILDAIAKAGEALRNQYIIGYRMPDGGPAGKWHQVRVKSNLPALAIDARSGYYAP